MNRSDELSPRVEQDDPAGTAAPAPLAEDEIALLDESVRLIGDRADPMVRWFYALLFNEQPELRALFPPAMEAQRDRLFRAITGAVRNLGDPVAFESTLAQLGRDHRKYGVRPEHYETFGRALVGALAKYMDDVWVDELEDAWRRAYDHMARTMMAGAQEAAATAPAWWRADIVAHERRADDIAVITVRTDRPYDYRAGQFASIETPYRPRSWRTYSMATAASPDGLVEFHVRAVGAGFVSGPLVWRAAVGDALKLGPPQGDLGIDKDSPRDVLCIAGGTGLAPIKAMVDEMSRWNTARRATVFFGVRKPGDLYDIDALHRMAALNPWLTVVPCVSEEPSWNGETGTLAEVVTRYGSWHEHDVFLAGSPQMMRATLTRLRGTGVAEDRISFDVLGDTHPAAAQVIDLRRTRASRERQR